MLTETVLKISYSVIGRCSLIGYREMRKNYLVTGRFQYDFTESKTDSCMHFQCQNRRFRVFEAGYWKNFQN